MRQFIVTLPQSFLLIDSEEMCLQILRNKMQEICTEATVKSIHYPEIKPGEDGPEWIDPQKNQPARSIVFKVRCDFFVSRLKSTRIRSRFLELLHHYIVKDYELEHEEVKVEIELLDTDYATDTESYLATVTVTSHPEMTWEEDAIRRLFSDFFQYQNVAIRMIEIID